MNQTQESDGKLPRRDWLLLPLIVLSVTALLLGASDLVAARMFPERGHYTCMAKDPGGLPRQKPNCVCQYKNPEGPLVEYRFNGCGYRSSKPCGAKPADTLRVVFIGTSMTLGLYIPGDETFAARSEVALNRICHRPVEVQNMGGMVRFADQPKLASEALKLSPDVIVLTVGPYDLEKVAETAPVSGHRSLSRIAKIKLAWRHLMLKTRQSTFVLAAQHFMLLDKQVLYETFMHMGGSREVLSSPRTPAGEEMYAAFASTLDQLMANLKDSGVPVIVMAVPNRVAAAMVSNQSHLDGTDPLWFGRRISEIAAQDGALGLDVTPDFATVPHAERLYYPVDNHPTGEGHAVIARALVDLLTDGSIPQLAACRASQAASR